MDAISKMYEHGDMEYSDLFDSGLDWHDGEDGDEYRAVDYPDVPPWIEQDITCDQVAAILEGGCASGAYMPAVTYHQAAATMAEHGDAVLDYLEQWHDLDGFDLDGESWSGFACKVLSAAVEVWAMEVENAIDA